MVRDATKHELRVLVRREGEWWVAVCLDYFFATQARSLGEVKESFRQAYLAALLHAQQVGQAPFENLGPAPAHYAEEHDRAELLGSIRFDPVSALATSAAFKRVA